MVWMQTRRSPFQFWGSNCLIALVMAAGLAGSPAKGQVDDEAPQRGVYRSPRMDDSLTSADSQEVSLNGPETATESATRRSEDSKPNRLADLVRQSSPRAPVSKHHNTWVEEIVLKDPRESYFKELEGAKSRIAKKESASTSKVQQASHNEVVLQPPSAPAPISVEEEAPTLGRLAGFSSETIAAPMHDHGILCDGCDSCDSLPCESIGCGVFGCDSCGLSCDTLGCDAMGTCAKPWHRRWANASLRFHRDRWFGGIEYLMMWQRGNRLPPLVTSDASQDPDPETAGRLDQGSTLILVGDDRIMERAGSGVRMTLGTWLDDRECLSLVGRGWFAGSKNYHYNQNQDQTAVLTRPFLDVSDDQNPSQQNAFVVAFPLRASGTIHVSAQSEAYGADVSIRQYLYGDLGVTFDFLYGYQFMGLDENLGISSTSTSLDDDFAPIGSVFSVSDQFDISNEFHGGQIGLATSYRERCWSFNCLAKVGFGSLTRRATRSGQTVRTNNGDTAIDNVGLLVRSTNLGTVSDRTFGWVPELDLSLGWQRFAGWDVTFGYHIIAMTDALQSPGAIDPNLAVNLSEPPLGDQNPSAALRYRTFYLQGIHFGLQHVY